MAVEVKGITWGACQLLFLNRTVAVDTTVQDWLWKSWPPSLCFWTLGNPTAELYWPEDYQLVLGGGGCLGHY